MVISFWLQRLGWVAPCLNVSNVDLRSYANDASTKPFADWLRANKLNDTKPPFWI